jgi:ribonucleoside-diphosphate reductase alpha chain
MSAEDELLLSLNAEAVLKRRYLMKNARGEVIETPRQMLVRVARAVAQAELRYGKSTTEVEEIERSFYQLMVKLEFLPNSPTLMNAGTELGQLAACFVLPVEDSMEGIFGAVKNMAVIHQSGGGTGFSFSQLRPQGDVVRSTGGIASGPVSFMRVFDVATGVIKQGGKRRGANMGILHVTHPDIMDFIRAKEDGSFTNFNTSVAVTDAFLQAVERDEEYNLVNPRTQEPVRSLRARAVFHEIVTYAWKIGDPGLIFIDEINRHNPLPALGQIEATNPCITADTWIMTADGPQKVADLVGREFLAVVHGLHWKSSHYGFFQTAVKPTYRLKTIEGYEVRLTADHPVLTMTRMTRHTLVTAWIPAGELKPGDKVVLHNHRGNDTWKGAGITQREEGYLLGLLIGDGTIKHDKVVLSSWGQGKGPESVRSLAYDYALALPHRSDFSGWSGVRGRQEHRLSSSYLRQIGRDFGVMPRRKGITEEMEHSSSKFCAGLLTGLFDADGSVQGTQAKGVSVRLAQSDLSTLQAVQRMLLRFGICSRIYKNRRIGGKKELPDGKGNTREYAVQAQHELVISKDNLGYFAQQIGFGDVEKKERLDESLRRYKRSMNRERFVAHVEEVVPEGREPVYDVHIPGCNTFDANGFVVHNCGEQPLLPYESCNLGSINASKFLRASTGDVDWERLRETIRTSVRFLDDVIEVNRYPLPEIEALTRANRKIGLGVMGFAELLIKVGIPYNSTEALAMAEQLMRFVTNEARQCSRELGMEKGSFPNFEQSRWTAYEAMRNATVTTIAPTGTLSIIAGCSSGIEPLFAVAFLRNVMGGMLEINRLFEEMANARGFSSKELIRQIAKTGSIQTLTGIPTEIKRLFVTALEIEPEWHVRMQAAFQRHTDNSVSKTVNLPGDARPEDVQQVFLLAHQLKCKGITVYRSGSKEDLLSLNIPKLLLEEYMSADSEYTGECRLCSV